jgi:hypothetical protein
MFMSPLGHKYRYTACLTLRDVILYVISPEIVPKLTWRRLTPPDRFESEDDRKVRVARNPGAMLPRRSDSANLGDFSTMNRRRSPALKRQQSGITVKLRKTVSRKQILKRYQFFADK